MMQEGQLSQRNFFNFIKKNDKKAEKERTEEDQSENT